LTAPSVKIMDKVYHAIIATRFSHAEEVSLSMIGLHVTIVNGRSITAIVLCQGNAPGYEIEVGSTS